MRYRVLLVAIALTLGCQGPGSVPTGKKTPAPTKASAKPQVVGNRLPLAEAPRQVDFTAKAKLTAVALTGKVKLISDKGGAVIGQNGAAILSNNSGSLIGNNGSGLISDNGGALISDKGGAVVGQNGASYRVQQAQARPEAVLADAAIEVLDAAGKLLVGADGKPLGATTDRAGNYTFTGELPAENLILRIRLHTGLTRGGTPGQLFAVLPKDRRTGALDLDTASSFGARYVLDQYVKGEQPVFDRLPGAEAEKLRAAIEAARGLLGDQAPTYASADQVAALEDLRGKAQPVGQQLERIKAILLAGQANFGSGLQATKVSLSAPTGVVGDAAGNLYVSELAAFRVRKIAPDGTISVLVGAGARGADGQVQGQTLEAVSAIAMGPDGALYLSQSLTGQIRRVAPDGTMTAVVDGLTNAANPIKFPGGLAVAPDGTIFVGETVRSGEAVGRVLAIKDGAIGDITPPDAAKRRTSGRTAFPGIALAADGTLFAIEEKSGVVWRRKAGGQAWDELATLDDVSQLARLLAEPDGSLLVSKTSSRTIVRIAPDGAVTPVAGGGSGGDGGPATAARIGQPAGLWRSPAGDLFIADGDGFVRKVGADGTIRTVAGTSGVLEGDALALAVSNPAGAAVDAQGRVVFSEAGSGTIKRLEGRQVSVLAGTIVGYAGDGGPATAARFANPAGIAYGPDGSLWVVDAFNRAIRRIDPAGVVTTVIKEGTKGLGLSKQKGPYPPGMAPMFEPLFCAVSPKGLVYWSDGKSHQIFRQREDGTAEVVIGNWEVAGQPAEGTPARDCEIHTPLQLAFDAQGDLYFVAAGNSRILRIKGGDPANPVETVVGLTPDKFGARLIGGGFGPDEGVPATEAMLLGPTAFALDPKGGLLVAELGTSKLASFSTASVGIPDELIKLLPATSTRIRRVGADGIIRTVAGDGTRVLNDPGADDFLLYPLSLALDKQGGLVIADSALNQIKLLPAGSF